MNVCISSSVLINSKDLEGFVSYACRIIQEVSTQCRF